MSNRHLEGFPVVIQQAVVWGDMDSYRHVNNTVYFRYFENVRLEYFRQMGWFEYEDRTGIGPILAATQARFRKALSYPDTISVGARVTERGEDRFLGVGPERLCLCRCRRAPQPQVVRRLDLL